MDRAPRHSAMTGNAVKRYKIAGRPIPATALDFLPDVVVDAQEYDAVSAKLAEARALLAGVIKLADWRFDYYEDVEAHDLESDRLHKEIRAALCQELQCPEQSLCSEVKS